MISDICIVLSSSFHFAFYRISFDFLSFVMFYALVYVLLWVTWSSEHPSKKGSKSREIERKWHFWQVLKDKINGLLRPPVADATCRSNMDPWPFLLSILKAKSSDPLQPPVTAAMSHSREARENIKFVVLCIKCEDFLLVVALRLDSIWIKSDIFH